MAKSILTKLETLEKPFEDDMPLERTLRKFSKTGMRRRKVSSIKKM
jgi:hypothetical protein